MLETDILQNILDHHIQGRIKIPNQLIKKIFT